MDCEFIYDETKENINDILEKIYADFVEISFKDLLTINSKDD